MSGEGGPCADRLPRVEISPGAFRDFDALTRDAAIEQMSGSDAPLDQADELVAAITGAALKAIVAARIDLHTQGHTAENDEMLPLPWLTLEAQQHAALAQARIGITGKDRDLLAAERELALSAAFAMAAIDRLRAARGAS